MKVVTWILRVASTAAFVYMAWLVYNIMSGYWDWDIPYLFIVTVFRLLSLIVFFLAIMIFSGMSAAVLGTIPNDLVVGLYNTLVLRMWYMQPYGVSDPLTNVQQVFTAFLSDIMTVLTTLYNYAFIFLYFLCAAIGIALFLQSLVRMNHKFAGGAFISIQLILVLGAFRAISSIPDYTEFPSDFLGFISGPLQILALVSFIYLEISYQMIYSYSVGKPVEDREEHLKKQLLALRQATRKQDAISRGDKVSLTAMSRSSGATAFSFLREAISRKVVGSKDALENLDAVADVRRLQIFVDDLLQSEPNARDELTAKAAAPSQTYVIGSTIIGSAFRVVSVIIITFLLMSPAVFVGLLNLPPGIEYSAELEQPEVVLLFLVPVILLFPFMAMIISFISQREEVEDVEMTKEEKEAEKRRKKELKRKRKEAEKARREREKARKKRRGKGEERDEWDRALDETFSR